MVLEQLKKNRSFTPRIGPSNVLLTKQSMIFKTACRDHLRITGDLKPFQSYKIDDRNV